MNARLVLFCLALVIVWQVIAAIGIWPSYLFPSPVSVLSSIIKGIQNHTITDAIVASMRRMAIGFGIALMSGLVLGVMISQSRLMADTVGQLVLGLQTLPSICWLPLAVLWFGLDEKAIIFVVVAGAVWSITMAITSGIRNVPRLIINAARTMGAKDMALYSEVIFPAALPSIVSGVRQGWSFAWRSLMAGELLFFSVGLGQLLQTGRELNDISQVVAVMIVIMALGLAIEKLVFGKIEDAVLKNHGLKTDAH